MKNQKAYHAWKFFRHIRPWYFLIIAVVCGATCLLSLRANNLQMVKLRDAVFTADKNNGDVEGALRNLRIWVYGHMNTNLAAGNNVRPPIQLQHTYERLESARQAGAKVAASNEDLYNQAQKYCEKAIPNGFSGRYRISCIQTFIKEHSGSTDPNSQPIPKNLYQFDFVSPKWTPDLAGWTMLATIASLLLFGLTWLIRHFLKRAAH
jgi:hypothetical protein